MFVSSASFAEEYVIRVQSVGYEDVDVSVEVPAETVRNSIEAFIRPNQPFRSKVRLGPETLTLEGMLRPQTDGSFSLHVKYCHEADTGITVPTEDGNERPVLNVTSSESTVAIKLDRSVTIGGMETKSTRIVSGKQSRVESKLHHVLIVSRREPEQN